MDALEELEGSPTTVTWLPLGERRVRQGWPLDRELTWPELRLALTPEEQLAAWRRATGRAAPAPAPERLISPREEGRLRARIEQLSPAQRRAGSLPAWPPRRRVAPEPRGRYCRALSTSPAQRAVSAEPYRGGTKMADKKSLPSGPQMAVAVLEEADRPVHVKLIAARVLEQDRQRRKPERAYNGKTPEQTISAALTVSSNGGGLFVKTAPGVFALRAWPASKRNKSPELPEKPAAAASNGSQGSGSGRKRSASSSAKSAGKGSAGKRSGKGSPPAKRGRKTKAEKDAVLAEAKQEQQPAEAEAPAAA